MINHNHNLNLTKDNKVTIEITTKTIKKAAKEVVKVDITIKEIIDKTETIEAINKEVVVKIEDIDSKDKTTKVLFMLEI